MNHTTYHWRNSNEVVGIYTADMFIQITCMASYNILIFFNTKTLVSSQFPSLRCGRQIIIYVMYVTIYSHHCSFPGKCMRFNQTRLNSLYAVYIRPSSGNGQCAT
jgi:hypothetical protein